MKHPSGSNAGYYRGCSKAITNTNFNATSPAEVEDGPPDGFAAPHTVAGSGGLLLHGYTTG